MDSLAWWKEVGDMVKTWWPIVVSGVLWPFAQFVIKPAYLRAKAFFARVDDTMHKVSVMSVALGPNGGSSLADLIRLTARTSTMNAARVQAFIDSLDRALFEADLNGEYSRINRAMEALLGYSSDDLRGRGWITVVADEDRDRAVREWFHAIEDRRACVIRTRLLSRRGTELLVRISAQPMLNDASGEVVAWLGAVDLVAASPDGGTR